MGISAISVTIYYKGMLDHLSALIFYGSPNMSKLQSDIITKSENYETEKYFWIHELECCPPARVPTLFKSQHNEMEQLMLSLHNDLRNIMARPVLQLSQELCLEAGHLARQVARSGFYDHIRIGESTAVPHKNHDVENLNLFVNNSLLLDDDRTLISRVLDVRLIEYAMDSWRRSSWRNGINVHRIIAHATTKIGVG